MIKENLRKMDEFLKWLEKEAGDSYFEPTKDEVETFNNGEIKFEVLAQWWRDSRSLSIYFIEDEAPIVLRAWGSDIAEQMLDHDASDKEKTMESWNWLIGFVN